VAADWDTKPLTAFYVGDFDPSGMHMSKVDLPQRIADYGGDHVTIKRIALAPRQVHSLPSFSASDKKKDPRYEWFVKNHGRQCWELDAMDPFVLRGIVEKAIVALIEPIAWARCESINEAEQESLRTVLDAWGAS
jgi:hypothetical protein